MDFFASKSPALHPRPVARPPVRGYTRRRGLKQKPFGKHFFQNVFETVFSQSQMVLRKNLEAGVTPMFLGTNCSEVLDPTPQFFDTRGTFHLAPRVPQDLCTCGPLGQGHGGPGTRQPCQPSTDVLMLGKYPSSKTTV